MAATYKSEGVVLKRWRHREKDTLVRVLTRDFGKITARAISARKITSKLAGHLEPFVVADFFFAKSKTIDIVAGSNTIMSNDVLRSSMIHGAAANYIAEIVDNLTHDHDPDPLFYEYVLGMLQMIGQQPQLNILTVYAAIVQIFEYLGYRFELETCHSCKRVVTADEVLKFHFQLRGLECGNCRSIEQVRELSADSVRVLRFLQDESFETVAKLSVSDTVWRDIDPLIRSSIAYQLGKSPKSEVVFLELIAV